MRVVPSKQARLRLALARWQVREATRAYSNIRGALKDPDVLERLALCAELEADWETADAHFARAERIDPAGHPSPARFTPEEFDAVIQEGVRLLDPSFVRALQHVAIVVDPMPAADLCREDPAETPPELLGLFVGASLLEQSQELSGELPPTVFLFQRNLERACADAEELAEQIRVTLFHELGHALGFDEDGVAEMGLE